jgi:hypothetical protein
MKTKRIITDNHFNSVATKVIIYNDLFLQLFKYFKKSYILFLNYIFVVVVVGC